jgi:serine/threonine-protein kinase
VGPASDLYSLGVVGYYALAGTLPFQGSSVAEVLAKHLTQPAPALASVAPEVSGILAGAIDRCLAKAPDDRYPDGAALAEALAAGTAVQRELPIPLRVFVRSMRDMGAAVPTILMLWLVIALAPFLAGEALSEWPFWLFLMLAGLSSSPVGILALYARRLLAAGYTLDDGRLGMTEDGERRLEEIRFEYGKGLTWVDKTLRSLGLGGILLGVGSVVVGLLGGIDMSVPAILGGNVGIVSAFLAALRGKWSRDLVGDVAKGMLKGVFGRWTFVLGGLGLERKGLGAGAHRPTEMAISMAADRLFDELPKEYRRELKGLPATIARLEADARAMRRQVAELGRMIAEVGDDTGGVRADERGALRADLASTRAEAGDRLTEAVSALEKIRLGLLRLHAGNGTVESLTLELGSANELSRAIDGLLEGQRDVARLLRPPELRTNP